MIGATIETDLVGEFLEVRIRSSGFDDYYPVVAGRCRAVTKNDRQEAVLWIEHMSFDVIREPSNSHVTTGCQPGDILQFAVPFHAIIRLIRSLDK